MSYFREYPSRHGKLTQAAPEAKSTERHLASLREDETRKLNKVKGLGGRCDLCVHANHEDLKVFCSLKKNKVVNPFSVCHLFEG